MSIVYGGRTNYGEAIGILMLDTVFPRIPGDVGNAATFPFPVRYKVIKGASPQRVVKEADPTLLKPFIDAARELQAEGVRAIATSCGFLAIFQKEMAEAVTIPVATSSLLQINFVRSIIGRDRPIGIVTARAQSLTERHFRGVGADNAPLVIAGMDEQEEFSSVFIEQKTSIDVEKCRREMVDTAQKLLRDHPDIGAVVLECTNMPPFAKDVQSAVKLPVFDVVTMINYLHQAVVRTSFAPAMI